MAGNLVANADFENATGDNFDSWGESENAPSTVNAETVDVYSGSKCVRLDVDGTNYVGVFQVLSIIEVGQEYTLTFWAKTTSDGSSIITQTWCANKIFYLTESWRKYTYTTIALGILLIIGSDSAADESIYIDKVSLVATPVKTAVIRGTGGDVVNETTDFTEAGFGTPKAAIVYMCYDWAGSSVVNNATMSIGLWDGTSQYCAWNGITNGVGTTECDRGYRDDAIAVANLDGSEVVEYTISNITDGIRITCSVDNTTVNRYITVILIGGADVESDVHIFNPANADYATKTGLAFRPDLLLFASSCTNEPTNQSQAIMSFGAASRYDGLINRGVFVGDYDDQTTSQNSTWFSTADCIGQVVADVKDWSAKVTQFNADGFTTLTTSNPSSDDVICLALKMPGVAIYLDNIATPTSTGTDATTGLGFKPELLMITSCSATTSNGNSEGLSLSAGAGNLTQESSNSIQSRDGVSTSNAKSLSLPNVINMRSSIDGSAKATATIDSFDVDGFTLDYTAAVTTTRGWVLAIANTEESTKLITTAGGNWLVKI